MEEYFKEKLGKRNTEGLLRKLEAPSNLIDFSSNDYLGFAHSHDFYAYIKKLESRYTPFMLSGSGASRLISGNHELYNIAENISAEFHNGNHSLIFNSGYDANLGLISSIATRSTTFLFDEYCHASIRDGIRLGFAKSYSFKHNDLNDFKKKLSRSKGKVIAIVESVYSMDGIASGQNHQYWIHDLIDFCNNNGVEVIVDEAHGTGVFGKKGEGVISECQLENKVLARVHTFGKALGVHGACVIGSENLKQFLINFSRSFIYSTALPPHSLLSIIAAYQYLIANQSVIQELRNIIDYFSANYYSHTNLNNSAIHYKLIPGNRQCRNFSILCKENGFDVRPILSPTVPIGKERLRICLHSFNKKSDIDKLINITGRFNE